MAVSLGRRPSQGAPPTRSAPICGSGGALVPRRLRTAQAWAGSRATPAARARPGRKVRPGRRLVRYLISGYYGEGNIGDEAILAGIIQEVGRHDPEASYTVLSFDPADTERRHGRAGRDLTVLSTSLRSPAEIRAAMR